MWGDESYDWFDYLVDNDTIALRDFARRAAHLLDEAEDANVPGHVDQHNRWVREVEQLQAQIQGRTPPLRNEAEVPLDDHLSGTIRCRWQLIGGHVHCQIFGPFSGKAGDLIFRVEEWDRVRAAHPHWRFAERDS